MEVIAQAFFLLGTVFSFLFGMMFCMKKTERIAVILLGSTLLCGFTTCILSEWLMELAGRNPWWRFMYIFTAVNAFPVLLFMFGALVGERLKRCRRPVPIATRKPSGPA